MTEKRLKPGILGVDGIAICAGCAGLMGALWLTVSRCGLDRIALWPEA